jgi:hypothetical protein
LIFRFPDPDLQIGFAGMLAAIRSSTLQDALGETVGGLSVPDIDRELAAYVPPDSLSALAAHGLRGEMIFPVPVVLTANPRLLGYYRLLYGYSQKEFYTAKTGGSRFKSMEERGRFVKVQMTELAGLCVALCGAGALLLSGIGTAKVSAALLDDLTLLTLGPQLRGGANVRKGTVGILTVFNAIHDIVKDHVVELSATNIGITNAAGRRVLITFASDPDIIIREEMRQDQFRHVVAVEVKAGSDFSNIHNRIGEAEKSHQKAKAGGYAECWTVVNVDNIDIKMAHQESPSTNHFYRISALVKASGGEYQDFRDRVISLTGIPAG